MQQHPVPRNITGFQFKLIGDMTLKQFGYLAAGAVTGYLLFRLFPGPGIIKITIGLAFGGGGAALAFLPIQGRPLDIWVISFIKSIYAPTQFVWQKQPDPSPFLIKSSKTKNGSEGKSEEEKENMKDVEKKLSQYMKNKPDKTHEKVEKEEAEKLKKKEKRIKLIHQQTNKKAQTIRNTIEPKKPQKPVNQVNQEQDKQIIGGSPLAEFMEKEEAKAPPKAGAIRLENQPKVTSISMTGARTQGQASQKLTQLGGQASQKPPQLGWQADKKTETLTKTEKEEIQKKAVQEQIKEEYKKEIERLERQKRELEKRLENMAEEEKKTNQKTISGDYIKKKISGKLTEVEVLEEKSAAELGFPQTPNSPNLISGVVLDPWKKPLPDILITVRAEDKTIVRTLKTNSLGQFSSTTPLKNGAFYLEIEDPGGKLLFDIIKIRLHGIIFKPVEVIAKQKEPNKDISIREKLFAKA